MTDPIKIYITHKDFKQVEKITDMVKNCIRSHGGTTKTNIIATKEVQVKIVKPETRADGEDIGEIEVQK